MVAKFVPFLNMGVIQKWINNTSDDHYNFFTILF